MTPAGRPLDPVDGRTPVTLRTVINWTPEEQDARDSEPGLVPSQIGRYSDVVERLLRLGNPGEPERIRDLISKEEVFYMCMDAQKLFLSQPAMLELAAPVRVVGDTHGHFYDTIRIFNKCGFPPLSNYLFLGDYVDHGECSIENILLLLAYKLLYPLNFFLLRGHHENVLVNRQVQFKSNCLEHFGSFRVFMAFQDPSNATVDCVMLHGFRFVNSLLMKCAQSRWLFFSASCVLHTKQRSRLDPGLIKGCTSDCDEVSNFTIPCPASERCQKSHVRHWTHLVNGTNCALTACATGTLHPCGGRYVDVLVCKNGNWKGHGSKDLGKHPAITCGLKGCEKCTEQPDKYTTEECPFGEGMCDPSLLRPSIHPDTRCKIFKYLEDTQHYVLIGGVWSTVPYIDCHHNEWWRLGSVRTMKGPSFNATCALPAYCKDAVEGEE